MALLDLDLTGRVAVVTGAAQGIGRSVAEHLAEAGVGVAVCDLDGVLAEKAAAEISGRGAKALAVEVDVSDERAVGAAVEKVASHFSRIDILVNCAGVYLHDAIEEMSPDRWHKVIDINLTGAYHFCHHIVPHMKRQNFGRIINVASGHAFHGGASGVAHYAATKAGVIGMARALAKELGPHGIRVNTVSPTLTHTRMPHALFEDDFFEKRAEANPCRRLGQPEDIARGVVFLSSRWSEFVNGHTLVISGGDYMI